MANGRGRLSKRKSAKVYKKGKHVNGKNFRALPMRGGFRL